VLGWRVSEEWGGNGAQRGTALSGGGIKVVIAERAAEAGKRANAADCARFAVHLDIHDVEARFRALPKGGHVVVEPEDTHWGTRWFVVRDPDGNRIAFEELDRDGG
jgi:uncharacterized glyoxalase superfamily protein PhnB